jgi:hypothetical protein
VRRTIAALICAALLAGSVARAESPPPTLLSRRPAWWRDWPGWALTTTGSFMLLVAAIDLGATWPRWENSARDPQNAVGADTRLVADAVVMALGLGIAIGGVVRFALIARPPRRERVWLAPSLRGLALAGVF